MDGKPTIPGSIWNWGRRLYRNPKIVLFTISFGLSLIAIVVRGNFYNVSTWENGMIARNLIQGQGFSGTYLVGPPIEPTSVMAPFYPYFMAGMYGVFGINPSAYLFIQIVHAIIQAGAVVLLFLVGKQVFNKPVGFLAGLGLAFYPDHIYGVTVIHQLTFSTFIILVIVFACLQLRETYSQNDIVILGIVLGIGILIKPPILYFAPIIPLWLLGQAYPQKDALKKAFKSSLVIATVSIIIVLPWTIRNILVHDQFVLVKQIGWNFWRGNVPPAIHTGIPNTFSDASPTAQQTVQSMSEAEANEYLLSIALEYVTRHPSEFLTHMIKNMGYFWWFPPSEYTPSQSNILRQLFYSPLLIAGLAGIVLSMQKWRRYTLFYGLFISFTIGYSIFFIRPRYRVATIQPYLILFAGFAIYTIIFEMLDSRIKSAL